MSVTIPLFRSTGEPGHSTQIHGDQRHVTARKRIYEIQVRFSREGGSVHTNEGTVQVKPGDAILTGIAGERWRVSIAHFADKYQPVPPTRAGEDGRYRSLPIQVIALQMNDEFEVLLADGVSRLRGHSGDWLVDYGDGSLGIVAPGIFASTYNIET